MRSYYRCGLVVAVLAFVPANLSAGVATLTPQEVADGWLLLFDGQSTFGWLTEGEVRVEQGKIVLGGKKASWIETTCTFMEATVDIDMDLAPNPSAIGFHNNGNWLLPARVREGPVKLGIEYVTDKGIVQRNLRVEGKSGQMLQSSWIPKAKFEPSPLRIYAAAGQTTTVRSVRLKPNGLGPIFNGKDLTGWREFPGQKSKFSVTPEGWLHLENGKGDLQTKGSWADFLLQVECKTNGDHLNSGVFFRCRPNEYQQGYEAQISNWFGNPKDYTIETFDPKSHELVSKTKVKYDAVDFGTGSVYRRVPARMQAAKDREWFGMTVLAEGRHLAVWVNGLLVCDWTDNRPLKDNARNGCRLEAGPISLQGHDATTNLDFRNIRIAAYPEQQKTTP